MFKTRPTTKPVGYLEWWEEQWRVVIRKSYSASINPLSALISNTAPVWSPHYRKDKVLLERVLHRFTRMFSHLRHLEYEERLNILGLWSLEERRNRADLLEVYKMAWGKSGNSLQDLFTVDNKGKTRRHSLKLIKKYSKGNTWHYFFTERVISRWNSLPQEAVCAPSISAFKGHLTRIRNKRMGIFKDC